ncbi:HAD family hydrolase [Ideonella alba]|uniref:HAD family hydrolase n=1 Tax=Ideonella alba TaxID=2824118 RepID=A0A940Y6R9_9BURK|nr:HAD family hydrolase [Ideonella alba]MBQ0929803.1 HAD family hydrolase [Ideonella alba]
MVRALLFDLDDTLLDDRGAMADAVLLLRQRHRLAPDIADDVLAEHWDRVGRDLWRRMERGELDLNGQRRERMRRVFDAGLSDNDADALVADYLEAYARSWRLLPGALDLLQATAHLPRAAVTNGHEPQALRKLEHTGIHAHFDVVLTPQRSGTRKPDPRMFRQALDLLGVAPAEAAMIGDNAEADIAPAQALGMATFHLDARESGRRPADALDWIRRRALPVS